MEEIYMVGRNLKKEIGEKFDTYTDKELESWVQNVKLLEKESTDLYILFNNNSGGDAADNAKRFIEMLNIEYDGLAPRQLHLF
jgi:uncharacterized protein YecE (DUF72 family)